MDKKNIQPELLSPAGSLEGCKAAIAAGADAVYLGGEMFGARAFAKNLTKDEIIEAVDFAHLFGKKIYLTLNTLLKNKEIKEKLYDFLKPLYEAGLDAVIVQDLGVLSFVRKFFPDLAVHASTQMTITSYHGAKILKEMGVSRVVPAREISLEETRLIYDNTGLEIESFVHGALCYCYSGQCLFSSIVGGRSGNRGRCAGPCRLAYDLMKNKEIILKDKYLLSPKDICTIELIPKLVAAGVCSFKIEGRMKRSEYSAGVTAIYRKYIDLYIEKGEEGFKVDKKDLDFLKRLYSRDDFSNSYYENEKKDKKILKEMLNINAGNYMSADDDFMNEIKEKYIDTKIKRDIEVCLYIRKSDNCIVKIIDKNKNISEIEEDFKISFNNASEAKNRPLDEESVKKSFLKTGNSDFNIKNLEIFLEEGCFMPVSSLNEMRREALQSYKMSLLKKHKRTAAKINKGFDFTNEKKSSLTISAYVSKKEQLEEVEKSEIVTDIYLDFKLASEIKDELKDLSKAIYIALPQIYRRRFDEMIYEFLKPETIDFIEGFLIGSLDQYELVKSYIENLSDGDKIIKRLKIVFNHNLYSFNDFASHMLLNLNDFAKSRLCASFEHNKGELLHKAYKDKTEVVLYSRIPLMVTEGCLANTSGNCMKDMEGQYKLKDRKNNLFPVKTNCNLCLNTIYNCKVLNLLDEIEGLHNAGYGYFRLEFVYESKSETKEVLNALNSCMAGVLSDLKLSDFTRGHYKRGVD